MTHPIEGSVVASSDVLDYTGSPNSCVLRALRLGSEQNTAEVGDEIAGSVSALAVLDELGESLDGSAGKARVAGHVLEQPASRLSSTKATLLLAGIAAVTGGARTCRAVLPPLHAGDECPRPVVIAISRCRPRSQPRPALRRHPPLCYLGDPRHATMGSSGAGPTSSPDL